MLNNNAASHTQDHPNSNWRVLGRLDLPVGVGTNDTLKDWLKGILKPLELPADFHHRFLSSARQTVLRILQMKMEPELNHIHLIVFVPLENTLKRQIWGFFTIEKIEDAKEGSFANEHTVEIYMYVEGSQ